MQAIVLTANNTLTLQNVAIPTAQTGESIVKIKAAALNHRDVWIWKGQYAGLKYPTILGSDGCGVTEEGREVIIYPAAGWGDDVRAQGKNFKVLGLPDNGTFAEMVAVPTAHLLPKPQHLTAAQAAALPLAGLTAYRALFSRAQYASGERVLVTGIGGGVALLAMQMAVVAGAEVWVTSSSDEKIVRAIAMGAKGGINYRTEPNWAKNLAAESGGFDVLIDSAVSNNLAALVQLANTSGRIVFFGDTTLGEVSNFNTRAFFWKQLSLLGTTMGTLAEFGEMGAFVAKHQIVPTIDSVFALENAHDAFQLMDNGGQFGKIVLKVP